MKKLSGDTTFDRIQTYYLKNSGVTLTPKEEEIRKRCEIAFGLFKESYSVEDTVRMLRLHFKVSRSTAYEDVRMAIRLYADVAKTSKEGVRNILYELAMKAFNLAEQKKDTDQMNKAIANMIKLKGLDKDESEMPDWSEVTKNVNIIIVGNPKDVGLDVSDNLESELNKFKTRKRQIIPIEPDGGEKDIL